jgi:hypothetical protein
MKEDNNNIKMLIAAILKLSSKLSKCNTSANAPNAANAPKTSAKAANAPNAANAPKTSAKAANAPKTSAKAAKAPKTSAKAANASRVSSKAASKTVMRKIVGGGSAEFFE